ncbi:MAG: hypothetical protein HY901_04420, partial [Deltaproteobacteria bacterium]|nr:hypothetical protein [Deltaproteobacteria bacterium]
MIRNPGPFLVVVVGMALVGVQALAETPATSGARLEATRHLERGLRSYDVQQYEEAIAQFKKGYQLDPRPEFLFALAQAERLRGNCRNA